MDCRFRSGLSVTKGHEFVQFVDLVIGDATENVSKPSLRCPSSVSASNLASAVLSDQQEFYQLHSYKGDIDLLAKLDERWRF